MVDDTLARRGLVRELSPDEILAVSGGSWEWHSESDGISAPESWEWNSEPNDTSAPDSFEWN